MTPEDIARLAVSAADVDAYVLTCPGSSDTSRVAYLAGAARQREIIIAELRRRAVEQQAADREAQQLGEWP